MIKKLLLSSISLLDFLVPKKHNYYLFSSAPDVSDNVLSFFRYLYSEGKCNDKLIFWMLNDVKDAIYYQDFLQNLLEEKQIKVKFITRNSLTGLYYYLRSKFVFFSHGIYKGVIIPKSHIVVNLWHGMPIKKIGLLDSSDQVSNASLVTVTSKKYQKIFGKAFDMREDNVLITGQPRCDELFTSRVIADNVPFLMNRKKNIVWMPTYRRSIKGDIRVDGKYVDGFEVLNLQDLNKLDNYLEQHNYSFIIKLHPMDVLNNYEFDVYQNITIIKDIDISDCNITLYELLSCSDLLLTDYSSVYIDYLLTNKPVAFFMSDFDDYLNHRGFVFNNPVDIMPGKFISNYNELIFYLDEIFSGFDEFKEQRKKVNKMLNFFKGNFSKRIFEELKNRYNFG